MWKEVLNIHLCSNQPNSQINHINKKKKIYLLKKIVDQVISEALNHMAPSSIDHFNLVFNNVEIQNSTIQVNNI